jgi:hypothetical protein
MDDLQKYEQMSKRELLDEVMKLRLELHGERAKSEGLIKVLSEPPTAQVPVRTEEEQAGFEFGQGNWKLGTVVERRPYRNGHLTNEYRRNRKTGTLTGPYWQYRGVEQGKQINVYLGKTDDPETKAADKLATIDLTSRDDAE